MKNIFSKKVEEIDEEYMNDEITKIDGDDVDVVMDKQEDISKKITSSNMLEKYTELAKVMFGMLKDYRKGIYTNVPWFTIASIAFAFLYVLNPLDIIPDFIPGLGYIDDLAVLSFGLRFIESDLHNYLDWKLESEE
ncbi:YkvA family protein [Gillisia sp. JM1]|uniref:YkvA family protein n=1 Tax=Gillisia sp. JM1 TaxID=1283286 RepID=UPI000402FF2E|nr:YkvA family protein [Gillisia sp. JM1]